MLLTPGLPLLREPQGRRKSGWPVPQVVARPGKVYSRPRDHPSDVDVFAAFMHVQALKRLPRTHQALSNGCLFQIEQSGDFS